MVRPRMRSRWAFGNFTDIEDKSCAYGDIASAAEFTVKALSIPKASMTEASNKSCKYSLNR
ncbi:MAG: hypothetical protein CM1200mP39_20060 [Dehalococcoidia bacterium]|nr:MAG: hypothetical protein CM1200mP39_20060 [Dehalococcoidia bacterium]